MGRRHRVERIGHRGAKTELPENTIAAFKRAFDREADAIELDVHATADGMVVVHHDPDLGRGFGSLSGRPIAQLEWSELARSSESAATRIPMLSEVFGIVPPAATVYVEIKGTGIEGLVAQEVLATRVRSAVHSFDHACIERMRQLAPGIPRGILIERGGSATADVLAAMARTAARDVWPEWTAIDRALVEAVHGANGRVIAWTVNDVTTATTLAKMGVDGICTDDVRMLDALYPV
jgi:glycerophosphoryl diester phosphodiesterase